MLQSPQSRQFSDTTLVPLESGDHLTRDEFERRYAAMPQVKKAELIEGIVYMQAAVRFQHHGRPNALLAAWLVHYEAQTQGVLSAENSSARLDLENMPQPDVMLLVDPQRGGQAQISDDDYVENAPELVGEIAASTASIDLHAKLEVYRRNGVREYLVWRTTDREIDWFVLHNQQYQRLTADSEGVIRSTMFPGLWLDVAAILAGDMAQVFATLDQGLATAEHARFANRLSGE